MATPRKKPADTDPSPETDADPETLSAMTETVVEAAEKYADPPAIDIDDPSTYPLEADDTSDPLPDTPPPQMRIPPAPPRVVQGPVQPRPFNFPAPPPRLQFGRLIGTSHKWRTLAADIPAGTEPEQMLEPDYWSHHEKDIEPNDVIIAVCEDGLWEGWFRVVAKFTAEVQLSPILIARHESAAVEPISDVYEVAFISAPMKYGVRRAADGAIVKDHLPTQSAAYQWLRNHLANLKK